MLERRVIERAWHYIDEPESWTAKAIARDRQSHRTLPNDRRACRWCAIGAIERAFAETGADDALQAQVIARLGDSAEALFGTRIISDVNDRHGYDAVRRLFEHSIAHSAVIEAAEAEDQPTEVERLRRAVGLCLGRIGELEELLAVAEPPVGREIFPGLAGAALIAQIEQAMAPNHG